MQEKHKKPLIVLTGPTAVGKTALSIGLAKAVGGEIISADSMQVYKGMDIGTAKIMPEEMQGVKHYLVDELEPDEEFNVVVFQRLCKQYMEQIYAEGRIPIIVGGTGFYIQSILNDIDFTENEADTSYRQILEERAKTQGVQSLHAELCRVDEKAAEQIHPNNVKRVIRALEYYHQTGEKISEHNESQRQKNSPYDFIYYVLRLPREILYDRINRRVDLMREQGLEAEVRRLREQGCTRNMVSMQGLGYKEMIDYLQGVCTLDDAVYTIKRDTRHFAKRQITWFKREKDVIWVNKPDFDYKDEAILHFMEEKLCEKGILPLC